MQKDTSLKKYELLFSVAKVPSDFLIIFASFFIAREIRLITDLVPGIELQIQSIALWELFHFAIWWSIFYVLVLAFHKLYYIKLSSSKIQEFLEIIRYSLYWFLFFWVFLYLGKGIIYQTEIPRLILGFTLIIGTTWVILIRILLNNLEYYLLHKGLLSKRNIVLIHNWSHKDIKNILDDIKKSNIYHILWYSNSKTIEKKEEKKSIPYLWWIKELLSLFENKKCDEILFIESDYSKKQLMKLWELSRIFGIRYRYITNNFDITQSNTSLSLIHNIPTIEIKNTPLDNWWKVMKRFFDFTISLVWIIVLSPLLLIIMLAIKLENLQAPVIYKNRRTGQRWKEFYLYKFRYMKWEYCVKDAYNVDPSKDKALEFEKQLIKESSTRSGPLYKIKNDPRKTKVWAFIEKYSLDELPQLYNVLLGNMSLVWPRPHQPREVEKYSLEEKRLLTIKPGISGMAQVNGRDANSFKSEARLDIFYIENWSLLLDLKILLKTVAVVLNRK